MIEFLKTKWPLMWKSTAERHQKSMLLAAARFRMAERKAMISEFRKYIQSIKKDTKEEND